jgi:hypothetical protein
MIGLHYPSRLNILSLLDLHHRHDASEPGVTIDLTSTHHIRTLNLTKDFCGTSADLSAVRHA